MKNFLLIIICIITVCKSQAQRTDSTYQITSGGRTELISKRYSGMIKAWVENVKVSGHVLKVNSKVSFAKAVVMRYTKNAQNQLVSDDQIINYNPSTFNLEFLLDSPKYKGGLQYNLLLYVNANDKDYSWRIHLVKK